MKAKIFSKNILFIFTLYFFPLFLFAMMPVPFGGRITTVKTPPTVECATDITSPFMIAPVMGLPGPWSAFPGQVNIGRIIPNAWILGLIVPGPGTCVLPATPPVPFPTTTTNFYGTSAPVGGV